MAVDQSHLGTELCSVSICLRHHLQQLCPVSICLRNDLQQHMSTVQLRWVGGRALLLSMLWIQTDSRMTDS